MKKILLLLGFTLILFSCEKENSDNSVEQEIELSKIASEEDASSENLMVRFLTM